MARYTGKTIDKVHEIQMKFVRLFGVLPSKIYLGTVTLYHLENESGCQRLVTPDNKFVTGLPYELVYTNHHIGVGFDESDLEDEKYQIGGK